MRENEFSIEIWNTPAKRQWNLYDEGAIKSSKYKSANVFLFGLSSNNYGNIFQNCFIDA